MQITELYIKNFGKFSNVRFELSDKIQVFYGENEYGKSTIYAFIRAMLFGMKRARGKAAANDAFSQYEPWDNPNYYAGTMRFISGGKHFFLERQFDKYAKRATLICEDDGEELSVEDGDLDMLLENMTEESFENTAALGHLTAKPGHSLANELKNCAANFYVSGSGTVDLAKALENLKLRKKEVETLISEKRREQDEKIRQYESQLYYVQKEKEVFHQNYIDKQKELQFQKKQDEMVKQHESGLKTYFSVITLFAVIGMTGILMWTMYDLPFVVGVISIMAVVVALLMAGRIIVQTGIERRCPKERKREDCEASHSLQKLQWECEKLQESWKEKQHEENLLHELINEEEKELSAVRELKRILSAIELAERKMSDAAEQMKGDFGSHLNEEASKIFAEITEDRYTKLQITEGLGISVFENNRWIQAIRLSRGTQEQIYFSLRMAALNLLYEEKIPVILDDAFVFYDEKRLKSTLKWLWEQQRQVIIFSCREREKEIVDGWIEQQNFNF